MRYLGFIVFLFGLSVQDVFCVFNKTEYYKMPPLYKFDDYDKCLLEFPEIRGTYCIVKTLIKADHESESWNIIQKYSSDVKMNFRHEFLERGICIKTCETLLSGLDEDYKSELFLEKFNKDLEFTLPAEYFRNTLEYRMEYDKLINQCVNLELRDQFKLQGYSTIEYCVSNVSKEELELDSLDFTFVIVVIILVALITISTFYDYSLKKSNGADHFKTILKKRNNMVLVSFSLPRNWYRLSMENTHDLGRELRFIQALRFLGMLGVVYGHSLLFSNIFPVKNPQNVEENYRDIASIMAVAGMQIVQTFFTISAFLIAVLFMDFKEHTVIRPNFNYLWVGIVYRYIRLTPVYAFIILLHATFYKKLGDGPVWNQFADTERSICRKNWWINLLYINNYYKPDEPCVQQGWYLGADFQLYSLALAILLLIWIYPRLTKLILIASIAMSYVIVGVTTYYHEFDGTILIPLDSQKYSMWFEDNYIKNYIPTHMNIGNFVIGLAGGIMSSKLKQKNIRVNEYRTFKIMWYLAGPILMCTIYVSSIFYQNNFPKPSVWMAVYAAFFRHLWGWLLCIIMIGFCSQIDSILRRVVNQPVFRPLGRISYCVFLCHMFVMRVTTTNMRDTTYFNSMSIILIVTTTFCLSCIMALIMCICIELPTSALYKNGTDKFKLLADAKRRQAINMNRNIIN